MGDAFRLSYNPNEFSGPEIIAVLPFIPHTTLGLPSVLTSPWPWCSDRVQPRLQSTQSRILHSVNLFPAHLSR